MSTALDLESVRNQFPALAREQDRRPVVFFDGPAGSQVPQAVADAISEYLLGCNANHGGLFATSRESDRLLDDAHAAVATLLGARDPGEVAFGANMTTLTLSLARALGKTWRPGDEILLSASEHDANYTPWAQAALDAGATVKTVAMKPSDTTLDLEDLSNKLTSRTRFVAVGAASNASGTVHPIAKIAQLAHSVGAELFVDAVHYAPHLLMDVAAWDCDYLACSAYKFFGPHVGILWGRRQRMEELPVYKLRTSPNDLPGRWMTGTQSHEGIAGVLAAVHYLAGLGRAVAKGESLRMALRAAYAAIAAHERELTLRMLAGLARLPRFKLWGIADPGRLDERVPTFSLTHDRLAPAAVADRLGRRGIFTWHGNFYALPLTEALRLEPDGLLRIGLLHYNTAEEVDRLLDELAGIE